MAPPLFWMITTFLFGICVGSFLNVVIYRLPIGGSLTEPVFSYCPNCKTRLKGLDLVPLFSFLLLGQKCRYCKKPISWRYFSVELLTGLTYVILYLRFPLEPATCVAMILFASLLIPIFFIDLEHFIIPDQLNLLAFAIALGRDVWGIVQHEAGHELLWGWMPRSVIGAIVGVLVWGAVRVLGWLWKRQEAMGLGDPLLGRALGAMLISVTPADKNPLWLFPAWVLFACFSGVIIGVGMIALRGRQAEEMATSGISAETDELPDGNGSSLGKELAEIGYCLWLGDLVDYVQYGIFGKKPENPEETPVSTANEPEWKPAPTAIPFGPFLIIGFLLTVFFGVWATAAYLAYALPKKETLP